MNLENAKKQFIKYTKNYDKGNPNIDRKIEHSLRVMKISKKIAENIGLKEEEINLATMIGLLHDIGRFEQVKRYGTFKDYISIDHADLGVEILTTNNFIREFVEENYYDEIILKAIKNHNKYSIEEGLTNQELIFAKLIRDADKVDILYESVEIFWDTKEERNQIENSEICDDVMADFEKRGLIDKKKMETPLDSVIGNIAYMFDLNYEYSVEILKQEKYINKILDKFDFKGEKTKTQIKEVKSITNNFFHLGQSLLKKKESSQN